MSGNFYDAPEPSSGRSAQSLTNKKARLKWRIAEGKKLRAKNPGLGSREAFRRTAGWVMPSCAKPGQGAV